MIRCASASQIFRDAFLLSRRVQQCSSAEIENLQTRLARESANALNIRAELQSRNAESVIQALRPWPVRISDIMKDKRNER
nr:MAG TPA: hypothetical protein [Caudoviricetes sp.]